MQLVKAMYGMTYQENTGMKNSRIVTSCPVLFTRKEEDGILSGSYYILTTAYTIFSSLKFQEKKLKVTL
jgi:hypothetical protein